ncbi:MAG: hypothetical protein RO009_22640 [Pseudorhodoplanes sp.]|jgi:hypothetical protein|nr:hypothetical protein [Pseudorhodoplanes sp.]
MKILIALLSMLVASTAFAHDSTVPHGHPHATSMFPDYAVMLLAAALVAGGVIAFRIWRKEGR